MSRIRMSLRSDKSFQHSNDPPDVFQTPIANCDNCIDCGDICELNDDCIACFKCKKWTHSDCAKLPKAVFKFFCNNECVEYFCKMCVKNKMDNKVEKSEDLKFMSEKLDKVISTVNTLVSNQKKNIVVPAKINFKKALTDNMSSNLPKKPVIALDKTGKFVALVKNSTFTAKNSADEIRKAVFTLNKDCKLIKSNFSPSGTLFLHFFDDQSLSCFLDSFKEGSFGDKSQAIKYDSNFKPTNNSVILKNVPITITDGNLLLTLQTDFPSVSKVQRFIKNGKPMQVVKVDLSDFNEKENILSNGFYYNYHFFAANDFIQIKLPTRCFKCQHYGHRMGVCKSKFFTCAKCGGKHETKDCSESESYCVNCDSNEHCSDSRECPFFQENRNKVNNFLP